jgi:hypothetical protein
VLLKVVFRELWQSSVEITHLGVVVEYGLQATSGGPINAGIIEFLHKSNVRTSCMHHQDRLRSRRFVCQSITYRAGIIQSLIGNRTTPNPTLDNGLSDFDFAPIETVSLQLQIPIRHL